MQTDIRIEWLVDTSECDQAGCSGGYEEGARVFFNGKMVLDLQPEAACYDGVGYSSDVVYRRIIAELGGRLEEANAD